MQLHPIQAEAVELCLDETKRIVAITGPAGSGKTTIIKAVTKRLEEQSKIIGLCAPTGKAARRITQATDYEAVTPIPIYHNFYLPPFFTILFYPST